MSQRHTVQQGECIASIAEQYGFSPKTIWDHPANEALRTERKNMNVLKEGDEVVIPDKSPRQEEAATDQTHRFRRKGVPETLTLRLVDDEGDPRPDLPYSLVIDESDSRKGATDGEGFLREPIKPDAKSAKLVVGEGEEEEEYLLDLGHLDPISEISGVQMRLNNLGFDCGEPEGDLNARTREAIEDFQAANDLEITGEPDSPTRDRLLEVHGD